MYFCLDTKVPKNQDQYGNTPWKRTSLAERPKTRCAQTVGLSFRKEGPLPPCGTAISVRVGRNEKQGTEERLICPFYVLTGHFWKKDGPQDGKRPAYVKKSICLSEASLMDFSKLAVFQVFLEDWA